MNPPGIGNPKTHIKFYDAYGVSNGEIFVEDKYSMMLNVDDRRLTVRQAFIVKASNPTYVNVEKAMQYALKGVCEQ